MNRRLLPCFPSLLAVFLVACADSEAIGTGKPVYWIALEGRSRRLQRFVEALTEDGVLRRFPTDGAKLEAWRYTPPDDTARAAATIRSRFGW